MTRNQNLNEELHIEEILLESNAFGMFQEVESWAKKLLSENPNTPKVKAYQEAYRLMSIPNKLSKKFPCDPDHNGECLVCDCWLTECAFDRWLNCDYKWETEVELDGMFKNYKKEDYEDYLHGSNN